MVGHAKNEGADSGTHCGAFTTGQRATADDCGNDVEELIAHALACLDGVEGEEVVHTDKPRSKPDEHEQVNLHAVDGHTDGVRGVFVATDGEHPVTKAGLVQNKTRDGDKQDPPQDGDLDRHRPDVKGRCEHLVRGIKTGHVGDGGGRDSTCDHLGDSQVQTLQ